MQRRNRMIPVGRLAAILLVSAALVSGAASGATPGQSAEVARLQAEVRELRQLVMQLMRVEKEHYDLLVNLYQQGRGAGTTGALPPGVPPPAAHAGPAGKPGETTATSAPPEAPPAPRAPVRTGSVRGKVQFPGGTLQDVYVYVENVKPSAPVRGKTVDIAQRGKRFVPDVVVVQRGTKVVFPNYDNVFHNVFSPTAPRPFDLGSYRAGDESKSVEMNSPGVVDVFCNMHSDMHATILVVPSSLYARVGADGSFHLDGVPIGTRNLVVWGPRSKPLKQTVEVGSSPADVSLTLVAQAAPAAHNNKNGQAYTSYEKD